MSQVREVEDAKQRFLRRYGSRDRLEGPERAAHAALLAALQRNKLYATRSGHSEVRAFWRAELERIGERYADEVPYPQFEADLLDLRSKMNDQFGDRLTSFRISHAQKSLAVYLKRLWCLGTIAQPPSCPVDRVILRAVNAPHSQRRWTTVDTVDEYRGQRQYLSDEADSCGVGIAEWELLTYDRLFDRG